MFNITNSSEHPTRPGHTIFHFYEKKRADLFTDLLEEENIWFESDIQNENDKITYFFGVKNATLKKVNQKNYLVNAQFRKPFIPNIYFRWIVFAIAIFMVVLTILNVLILRMLLRYF